MPALDKLLPRLLFDDDDDYYYQVRHCSPSAADSPQYCSTERCRIAWMVSSILTTLFFIALIVWCCVRRRRIHQAASSQSVVVHVHQPAQGPDGQPIATVATPTTKDAAGKAYQAGLQVRSSLRPS